MICEDCIHFSYCMERRGACREHKTLEDIANEIKSINEKYKTSSGSGANKGCIQKAGNRDICSRDACSRASVLVQSKAGSNTKAKTEAEEADQLPQR